MGVIIYSPLYYDEIEKPPSIQIVAPVIHLALSLSKKVTKFAISSGVPIPKGWALKILSVASGERVFKTSSPIGVLTKPGAIEFILIFFVASSQARDLTAPSKAAFQQL